MRFRFRFWASAFYFAYFGATGSFAPFLNAYYQHTGIPVEQIGILVSLSMLVNLVGNPLWSFVTDAFHLHGRLLPLAMLISLPCAWLLAHAYGFWPLAGLVMLYSFCLSPILSMGDYAVLKELGEQSYDYGKMRVWGAVGYGLAAWYGGAVIERIGFNRSVFIFLILMTCGVFIATRLPSPRLVAGASLRSGLRLLSTDTRWYSFLGCIFLAGLGLTTINSYFILYMKDLGAGEALFGLSTAIAGVSELPIFFFSAYLMRRWSPRGLLGVALGVLAVRLLLTSLFHNPWLVIAVQLLHGLSFSAMWSAGVNYANEIAPPGLGTSSQALFGATFFGLAGMLGALMGGKIYQVFGGVALFQISALVVLVGWVIFQTASRRSIRAQASLPKP